MPRKVNPSSAVSAASLIPESLTLAQLRLRAKTCQACELWKSGTQTVFGAGPEHAKVMLVGEQPGDQEDLAGQPFVGPAGQLLNKALAEVGIDRQQIYVTNAVKHFKWIAKGRRRLHQTPTVHEISACRPWLEREIALLHPHVLVCLGATAAKALLGAHFRVTQQRGEFIESALAPFVLATLHPAAILRLPDATVRNNAERQFIADLRKATSCLETIEERPLSTKSHTSSERMHT